MARSLAAASPNSDADELAAIEAWYRDRLNQPAKLPTTAWTPARLGPTWQIDGGKWLLPEQTLGWQVLAFCGRWLQLSRDEPWRFTNEQARFLLWWYATDDRGAFLFRDGVLQRLKGWGKDPVGACLCVNEMIGPARVGDIVKGQPQGFQTADAWVQTAAVALEQTKNTMRLLPGLFKPEAISHFDVQIGKEQVYADHGTRFFQAVTSSPTTLEGARATFVLANETQHWDASNSGHDMADVIERNATKSPDGAARRLAITNAYEPGLDSVAERDRDQYEHITGGTAPNTGLLYDSLEAPPEAPLTLDDAPSVIEAVRGDSVWLNVVRIVQSIADRRNPASRSRRFWYNQIVAAEDAWLVPAEFNRLGNGETVDKIDAGTPIVMFFDGSKSDDATGLAGCRLSDGHVFQIGVWQKPPGYNDTFEPWTVDRGDVNLKVEWAFETFKVVGFWADPSDTRDDTGERYWEALIDAWHQRYKNKLKLWATKTGERQHAVAWDMRTLTHQQMFTGAAERFVSDVEAQVLTHCGSQALASHVKNARRRPNKFGVTLGKEHRESSRKIDLAVCAVGARFMWRQWLNKSKGGGGSGRVVVLTD